MKSKKQHKVTALLLAGVMMLSAHAVYAEEMVAPVVQDAAPVYTKGDTS